MVHKPNRNYILNYEKVLSIPSAYCWVNIELHHMHVSVLPMFTIWARQLRKLWNVNNGLTYSRFSWTPTSTLSNESSSTKSEDATRWSGSCGTSRRRSRRTRFRCSIPAKTPRHRRRRRWSTWRYSSNKTAYIISIKRFIRICSKRFDCTKPWNSLETIRMFKVNQSFTGN